MGLFNELNIFYIYKNTFINMYKKTYILYVLSNIYLETQFKRI